MTLARPKSQDFVIVGATGDLAKRKLLPALYNLYTNNLLPEICEIIGFARTDFDVNAFRQFARQSIEEHSRTGIDGRLWEDFASRLEYVRLRDEGYKVLKDHCKESERTFYLAVPPDSVPEVVRNIGAYGLSAGARIVVEKPFGIDLKSAQKLNAALHEVFTEPQIFRIDHYLGKETVQNILVFRFANSVFERVWNREAIDHIQITVAEDIGIEGRGNFYEEVGALRDIVQNHALQMLALLAMEPPASFAAEAIRDEKAKLLQAVRPANPRNTVRGQYTAGKTDGEEVPGYRLEPGVAPDSQTETFVALRLDIANWRWAGVPIYLRTGKHLPKRATEVELAFKEEPIDYLGGAAFLHSNHLTLHIQPDEGITFEFLAKEPGPELKAKEVAMDFSYDEAFMVAPAEAYERLIHDVMENDQTLFVREDAVERAWAIVQPLLDQPPPVTFYPAGTWGPPEADLLVAPHQWHLR